MHKPVLSLGLLLGALSYAQAQTAYLLVPIKLERTEIHYGAFGSFQSSHYTASSSSDYTFRDNGSNTGGGGGLFMDMFFNPHLAFTVGLNTGSRGGKFTATYQGSTPVRSAIPSVSATYDLKTSYFYLPLGLKFFTGEVLPRTRLYAQGTIAAGFLTSATNNGQETHSVNNGKSTYKYSKQVGFLDTEVSAGLGAEIRLLDKLDAFASARYCYGVASSQSSPLDFIAYDDFYKKSGDAYPLHNVAVSVEVGLIYVPFRRAAKAAPTPTTQPTPIRTTYQAPASTLLATH
jgi:hypothetical protein